MSFESWIECYDNFRGNIHDFLWFHDGELYPCKPRIYRAVFTTGVNLPTICCVPAIKRLILISPCFLMMWSMLIELRKQHKMSWFKKQIRNKVLWKQSGKVCKAISKTLWLLQTTVRIIIHKWEKLGIEASLPKLYKSNYGTSKKTK